MPGNVRPRAPHVPERARLGTVIIFRMYAREIMRRLALLLDYLTFYSTVLVKAQRSGMNRYLEPGTEKRGLFTYQFLEQW